MTRGTGKKDNQAINQEIFNHLTQLAALELEEGEGEYLRDELNNQLRVIRELEAIDIDPDTAITSHGVPYEKNIIPPLREDIVEPCPEAEDILHQAPIVEDRYVSVPEIPHEELE